MNNMLLMELISLSNLAFFEGLDAGQLKLLEPYFTCCKYTAGTTIFEQGDHADYLYLVVQGEVVIRYKPEDGPAMIVTCVQPGGIFGWSAAMGNDAYRSGALVKTNCDVLRIKGKDLRDVSNQYPEIGQIILDHLAAIIAERQQCKRQVMSILSKSIQNANGRIGDTNGSP